MIEIDIPGFRLLRLEHLVLDYNGTLALDGKLLPHMREMLTALAADIQVHVVTADTFGLVAKQLADLPLAINILPLVDQAQAKLDYVNALGAESVVAMGNGRNDRKMLQAAAVGIALLQKEGGAAQTVAAADVVCLSITDALDLLRHPKRIVATLRS
ncbi:MAG: hypothetical protein VB032_01260 [Burkholderiaceae bacterium]|nr:hypothetical protein [Burkholderiaceae bacterium]